MIIRRAREDDEGRGSAGSPPSPRPVEIRRADVTSKHATELIHALNADLMGRYPEDGTAHHFRLDVEEVAPGRGAFLIAYSGERPVGCGAVRALDADTAEIKRMYVDPAARGQGVARRILDALELEARALGVRRLLLETGVRQVEAIDLYASMGFSPTGAFGEYDEHPLSLFMGKDLF